MIKTPETEKLTCSAYHITWGGLGYLCLNCGQSAEHSWDIKHKAVN